MSSLLPSMTGTTDETTTSSERAQGTTKSKLRGGSRRKQLGLTVAGIGAAALARRMRSGKRSKQGSTSAGTTGGDTSGTSTSGSKKRGSPLTGRAGRMVAGVVAAAVVRRMLRRWRRR